MQTTNDSSAYYYHAGAQSVTTGETLWSNHTRRTSRAAEHEARRMCTGISGRRPVVEYWERRHGLRPGDCELVSGAYEVELS